MKVFIRHINSAVGHACGEMNPEQLHHFVKDLKENGIHDGDEVIDPIDAEIQYICTADEFFAEVFWSAKEAA